MNPMMSVCILSFSKPTERSSAAVEAAYGVDFNGDEEKIVAHLFKLYAETTTQA